MSLGAACIRTRDLPGKAGAYVSGETQPSRRLKTNPFDAAEYFDDEQMVIAYPNEVLAEGDPAAVVTALGTVARARGVAKLARSKPSTALAAR